jgi:hypothetical protein
MENVLKIQQTNFDAVIKVDDVKKPSSKKSK